MGLAAVTLVVVTGPHACRLHLQTYIDYYPEAPPKAEGEEAEMLEHLRQLFGTTDGAGPCSARVAPGVIWLTAWECPTPVALHAFLVPGSWMPQGGGWSTPAHN